MGLPGKHPECSDLAGDITMVFLEVDMEFCGSCCENLAIKSSSQDFPQGDALGNFNLHVNIEEEPFVCYGASVFRNEEGNMFLYRSRCGSWVVGEHLGKVKKGVVIRSKEDDRESYAQVCPCKVQKWQVRSKEVWKFDDSIRVMIRRNKKVF